MSYNWKITLIVLSLVVAVPLAFLVWRKGNAKNHLTPVFTGEDAKIPTYEEMPADNEYLAKMEVVFPYLVPNSAKNCPQTMEEIQAYLRLEDSDLDSVASRDLTFLRTAKVVDRQFWIWKYTESDGEECYVTVELRTDGTSVLGMDGNSYNLSPEQFILGTYHDVF